MYNFYKSITFECLECGAVETVKVTPGMFFFMRVKTAIKKIKLLRWTCWDKITRCPECTKLYVQKNYINKK